MVKLADLPTGRQARKLQGNSTMWYVYALRSLTRNYIYVRLSSDVKRRLKQHNEGKEKTTRSYRPFNLILTERFETRVEARRREVYLKSGSGKEFLRGIVKETQIDATVGK